MGKVRSFVGNSMGGLRGGQNLASWLVAGTVAYYLWVKPAQDLKKEQEARALLAVADRNGYVEKRKPVANPQVNFTKTSINLQSFCGLFVNINQIYQWLQVTGLVYGNKNITDDKPQD